MIIDAAQAMAHSVDVLRGVEVDAICFSAHKLYAPSLGVIVWRDELDKYLLPLWLGGGMVDDVDKDTYRLSAENKEHRYTRFESGLQAWGEIVGLGAALDWLMKLSKKDWKNLQDNTAELYDFLAGSSRVHLVNNEANPTMSFYVDGIDGHLLGEALSREGNAQRSGVEMRMYRVIYDCINEVEAAMKGMLAPKFEEKVIGHVEIRQTFKVSKVGTVCGGYVQDGKIVRNSKVRVLRDNVVVYEGDLASLRRFKDDVKEVASGYECGLQVEKFNDIKEGDIIEVFVMEQIQQ